MSDLATPSPSLGFADVVAAERAELRRAEGDLAAICLSGGGIRSASLCLGVMQGFAKARLLRHFHYLSTVSGGGYIGGFVTGCIASQNDPRSGARAKGMSGIDYVETEILAAQGESEPRELSGLRRYTNYLTPNPGLGSPDTWAGIVLWFRNTLINWFIFFPIFVALAATPIFYFAIICMTAAMPNIWMELVFSVGIGLTALACLYITILHIVFNLPSHEHPDVAVPQQATALGAAVDRQKPGLSGRSVFWRIVVFAVGWSLLAPVAVAAVLQVPEATLTAALAFATIAERQTSSIAPEWLALLPLLSFGVSLIAYRHGEYAVDRTYDAEVLKRVSGTPEHEEALRARDKHKQAFTANRLAWGVSALLSASILYAGLWLANGASAIWLALFGPIWVILAETMRITLYVALRKRALRGDLDREWLARLNGIQVQYAAALCALGLASLLVPLLVADARSSFATAVAGGGLLGGPLTALAGRSAKTLFAPRDERSPSWFKPEWLMFAGIALFAVSLFALVGSVAKAIMLYALAGWLPSIAFFGAIALAAACIYAGMQVTGQPPSVGDKDSAQTREQIRNVVAPALYFLGASTAFVTLVFAYVVWATPSRAALPLEVQYFVIAVTGMLLSAAMAYGAVMLGRRIDLNNFSMHAVYRNRLVRAFLGSARNPIMRQDDRFTQFDPHDDIRVADTFGRPDNPRLFPVVNVALNRTSGKDTARAERKAESFTITPLHCGSRSLNNGRGAYVRTETFAQGENETGPQDSRKGITLGTAIALSGAAVSPNMGYHSSPLIAFVMTLFNVRLGAWMPNPGLQTGGTAKPSVHRNAVPSLLAELAGRSDEKGPFVYLSDGGHFDNLGLYEMLQRRCAYVVVVDAGQDEKYAYYDLGSTLQHARIDLGIEVDFIKSIQTGDEKLPLSGAYAEIVYPPLLVDGQMRPSERGRLAILKPWLPDDAPTDVRAFKARKRTFPHETTGNQFFTESDFESYRRLGEYLSAKMIAEAGGGSGGSGGSEDGGGNGSGRRASGFPADFSAIKMLFDGLAAIAKDSPPIPSVPPGQADVEKTAATEPASKGAKAPDAKSKGK